MGGGDFPQSSISSVLMSFKTFEDLKLGAHNLKTLLEDFCSGYWKNSVL